MKRRNSSKKQVTQFDDDTEIESLLERVNAEAPESGSQLRNTDGKFQFESFPISKRTLTALSNAKLTSPTDIQMAAIPHALNGRDILGAAKTGSGKTLAFVVPMLERLYREKWSVEDGLAAIILTPTRELALQIFDVIRLVGKHHQISAGLVTGGKKEFEEEQSRIVRMNILVATPGRLLQHMEQTSSFDTSQVLILILDEADRILDMGFKHQLDSILEYLPPRQTLLFSATQTKSVKDLARLSLNTPEYLAVHEKDDEVTPKQLIQSYIVCRLHEKLDTLFSFLKTHLKSKIIVFFSTCSQVRFVFECFRSMQPGIPLTALHGKIKQERRTIIFMDYIRRKHACLLCTDVAARGLDFPSVDWVIQLDAPEDSAMYIHRVGRTARYQAEGRALLMLLPHEEKIIVSKLQQSNVPIKKLTVNPKHRISVSSHASALLVSQPETRQLAKKAYVSYLRSLQMALTADIAQLDLTSLPLDEFSASLGLAVTPVLPLVEGKNKKSSAIHTSSSSTATGSSDGTSTTISAIEAREINREKKNVNRSLDKLKKQIKEAKELKKKAKEEAVALLLQSASSSSLSSSSGTELIESNDKNKLKKKSKKVDDESNNSSDDEDDGGDDLFTVKANHNWKDEATTTTTTTTNYNNNNDDENDQLIAENSLAKLMSTNTNKLKKKKALKLKINDVNTTEAVKTMRIAGATKITFDDDGEQQPVHKLKLRTLKNDEVEEENSDDKDGANSGSDNSGSDDEDDDNNKTKSKPLKSPSSSSSTATIKEKGKATAATKVLQHTKEIKARLDLSRAEDDEQDKLRIKEMHRLRRMRDKIQQQQQPGEKKKRGDEEEEGGVMLSRVSEERDDDDDDNNNSDDDDSDKYNSSGEDDDSDDDDDDYDDYKAIKEFRNRNMSHSDSDDEDDEDEDEDDNNSDDEQPVAKHQHKKQKVSANTTKKSNHKLNKKSKYHHGDDSGSDNGNSDDDVAVQEQSALKLLGGH